jgi:hypothetical protein
MLWKHHGSQADLATKNSAGRQAFFRQEDRTMAELDADARKRIPKSKFAEPDKRKYPIEDKPHARNAKARASQAVKAGRMSKAEEAKIDKKADAVLKKG